MLLQRKTELGLGRGVGGWDIATVTLGLLGTWMACSTWEQVLLALQTVHHGHVLTVCPGLALPQLLSQALRPEDRGSSDEARLHPQTIFALSQDTRQLTRCF